MIYGKNWWALTFKKSKVKIKRASTHRTVVYELHKNKTHKILTLTLMRVVMINNKVKIHIHLRKRSLASLKKNKRKKKFKKHQHKKTSNVIQTKAKKSLTSRI